MLDEFFSFDLRPMNTPINDIDPGFKHTEYIFDKKCLSA